MVCFVEIRFSLILVLIWVIFVSFLFVLLVGRRLSVCVFVLCSDIRLICDGVCWV